MKNGEGAWGQAAQCGPFSLGEGPWRGLPALGCNHPAEGPWGKTLPTQDQHLVVGWWLQALVDLRHLEISVEVLTPEPVSVTLFGNSAFAAVIKGREGPPGVGGPKMQ